MKPIVVYYSRTGTTKKVAEAIAKNIKCDCEEILDFKNRMGFFNYISSGFESAFKKKPQIKPLKKNASNYDLVVIGTPIWAGTMASPVITYIAQNKDKLKKVAFFCTMGGSGGLKAFKQMEKMSGKKPVAVLELRQDEADRNSDINEFIRELKC